MFELENEIKWDPLCSEAEVALLAINGALFAGMDYIIVEGDSLNVLTPFKILPLLLIGQYQISSRTLMHFAKSFSCISFLHVIRSSNCLAYSLAA